MPNHQSKRELLRKKRADQKRRRIITGTLIVAGVIALFAVAALLPRLLTKHNDIEQREGFTVGNPEAPVHVVQFSSYTCGYCKNFSDNTEADFIEEFVDPGKVYYRYVNLASSNEKSVNAAIASYCAAEQNRFFEYKDFLYTYANAADGFSAENLTQYAASANMDVNQFQTCLEADTYANAYLDDRRYAQSVGVTGTPTFLVNGELYSASDLIPAVRAILGD